jgi:hypothetical protein
MTESLHLMRCARKNNKAKKLTTFSLFICNNQIQELLSLWPNILQVQLTHASGAYVVVASFSFIDSLVSLSLDEFSIFFTEVIINSVAVHTDLSS